MASDKPGQHFPRLEGRWVGRGCWRTQRFRPRSADLRRRTLKWKRILWASRGEAGGGESALHRGSIRTPRPAGPGSIHNFHEFYWRKSAAIWRLQVLGKWTVPRLNYNPSRSTRTVLQKNQVSKYRRTAMSSRAEEYRFESRSFR